MKYCIVGLLSSALAFSQSQDERLLQLKRAAEKMAQNFTLEYRSTVTGPSIKGQPYSATVTTESTQMLADGNRIHREDSFTMYRDLEGRVRRDTSSGSEYSIADPVARVSYIVNPRGSSARRLPLAQQVQAGVASEKVVAEMKAQLARTYESNSNRIEISAMSAAPSGKSEDLGTKLIEGVSAQGTRLTTTIPAGAAGNDLPITIVDERWHSPELQITLVSQHSDPRTGTTVYRLSKISRANPSPLLFEIPAGFTITDVK